MAEKKDEKIDADESVDENDILEVQEGITINDGVHDGTITNVVHEIRKEIYDYLDFYVDLEDDKTGETVTIKTGFPSYISENSGLGRFLNELGMEFKPKDKIKIVDIKNFAVGQTIQFQTFTEDKYARIVNKSIKLIS